MNKLLQATAPILLLISGIAYGSNCPAPEVRLPTIDKGGVLVFGEIHGTKESPDYFLRATCAAVEKYTETPLLIGLEIPRSEQAELNRFIDSDGGAKAVQALLSQPFWTRTMQDGRSSRAIFEMVDGIRLLRKRAPNLSIHAIDDDSAATNRDASMAARIEGLLSKSPGTRALVLVGNTHAMRRSIPSSDHQSRSMVEVLSAPSQSLAFRPNGGRYWGCAPKCGVQTLEIDTDAGEAINWSADEPSSSTYYDGIIDLGIVSESDPAVSAKKP